MQKRIFIIGFMGSGKTTIGKELAEKLGYHFIDTDAELERKYKKNIGQLFSERGEDWFRNAETSLLRIISKKNKTVISTGGGMPCYNDNLEFMKSKGTVIYLKVGFDTIYERIKKTNRPLVINNTKFKLRKLYMSRREVYEGANIVVTSSSFDKLHLILQNL